MDKLVAQFLEQNRVCALSILLPDSQIHSAAMHYSHASDPLALFFSTENSSRKFQGLVNRKSTPASVVIGFSEKDWLTLQMSGDVKLISDDQRLSPEKIASIKSIHYSRHPASQKYADNPAAVFLEFTPAWWRFTDFKTTPPTYVSST